MFIVGSTRRGTAGHATCTQARMHRRRTPVVGHEFQGLPIRAQVLNFSDSFSCSGHLLRKSIIFQIVVFSRSFCLSPYLLCGVLFLRSRNESGIHLTLTSAALTWKLTGIGRILVPGRTIAIGHRTAVPIPAVQTPEMKRNILIKVWALSDCVMARAVLLGWQERERERERERESALCLKSKRLTTNMLDWLVVIPNTCMYVRAWVCQLSQLSAVPSSRYTGEKKKICLSKT